VGDGATTLVMEGEGPAIHLVGSHRKSADPGDISASVRRRERAPLLSGFEIEGAHPGADGILAEGTLQATFTGLLVRNVRHGLRLTGTNRNVLVSDSHFYNNRGVGVLMERGNLHQINLANCHISYNRAGGVVVRASEVRNLQIGNCDIEANMAEGGAPAANVELDARGGAIREVSITGCTLQHTARAAGSANLRLRGVSAEANQRVGYLSVTGNTMTDAELNLDLNCARGVCITGNTLVLASRYALRAEGCSSLVVGANVMDQNPDYRPAAFANAILLVDSTDCLLTDSVVRNSPAAEAALALRRCRRCRVRGVSVIDSGKLGLLLEESVDTTVDACTLDGGWPVALRVRGGRGNRVSDNVIRGQVEADPGAAVVERNRAPSA
jgi:hypothetical protein